MKIEDYNKYYMQGSDHYLIQKDVFDELFNEMVNWKEENKKQKEVIDKAIEFLYKIKFDKTDKYICISEYIEYQQLLDILKEVE